MSPPVPARRAFAKLTARHLADFAKMLGPNGRVVTDPDALQPYNSDWLRQMSGHTPCALLPSTTEEMSKVLAYCNKENLAVTPQGGNTGLVYGSQPVHDEIVLSTRRMTGTLKVNPETATATVSAGFTLQQLHDAAREHGFVAPIDLGARGSCFVTGNIATNAGGIHYARYGSMRANTLGMKAVMADGTVLDMMSSVRKDNTGYDLKSLLVGSEGTLGMITEAEVKLYPLPAATNVIVAQVPTFEAVCKLYALAQSNLAEVLAAFEVMDAAGLAAIDAPLFESYTPNTFCVLVETRGSNSEHDMAKLVSMLEIAERDGLITAQKCAMSDTQQAELWKPREELPVKLTALGTMFKFDICMPLPRFYQSVEVARKLLAERFPEHAADLVVSGYGHFGDGNLHLNVICRNGTTVDRDAVYAAVAKDVYGLTVRSQGSVSAEHGIGMLKKAQLQGVKSAAHYQLMRQIKSIFDPKGIMNPYKVIDPLDA
jgi:FAD/FMN-containing dehydrogenase